MKRATSPEKDLVEFLLGRLLHIVRNETRDLSLRQLAVLLTCQSAGQPQTIRGLAEQLRIFKPAVTRAVDRLEHSGLVERQDDPADKRSVLVSITVAGDEFCCILNRNGIR